ncbi:MAG: carboxy terminal-processing peptidase [Bacteroidota bacterium]|nr:carboxy terminal-processing peptidase [Bacteroidota bacterium]
MQKIKLLVLFIGFTQFGFAGDTSSVFPKKLYPEPQHGRTEMIIADVLSHNHYNRIVIDDNYSLKVYEKYLQTLDDGRQYFLLSDIKSFDKYKTQLDDELLSGNSEAGFYIYNTHLIRIASRVDFVKNLLKDTFSFSKEDYFQFDREKLPWFEDEAEQNIWWTKKVKYEALLMKLSGKNGSEINETLLKRYNNFRTQMSKIKSEDAFSSFMNAFTGCVDPHTDYFSPRVAEDFHVNMSQQLKGIGATLTLDGEYTKVRELVKGGPADRSKAIFDGDKIVGVGQGKEGELVDVVGWRLDDVVALIRGEKDTWVKLQIIPKTAGPTDPRKTIEIKRDIIRLEEQRAKCEIKNLKRGKKDYKIGVINLPVFYQGTTADVKKLLDSLKGEKIQALVFDLRNNTGGSLQEAITLSGLFIRKGPVVQVKNLYGQIEVDEDRDTNLNYAGPMTVLVNRGSASASEIFAAALQDYHRALIVGERTYGKGTVQNLLDMNQFSESNVAGPKMGEIKPTIAKFYRITGGSTQHRGVIPDVQFPSLIDSTLFGESADPYALPYDEIPPSQFVQYTDLDKFKTSLLDDHQKRMDNNTEFLYLEEDYEEKEKQKEEKLLPLLLTAAQAQVDKRKEKENVRNAKRKLDKSAKVEKTKNGEEEISDAGKYDLIMDEGTQILEDYLELAKSTNK